MRGSKESKIRFLTEEGGDEDEPYMGHKHLDRVVQRRNLDIATWKRESNLLLYLTTPCSRFASSSCRLLWLVPRYSLVAWVG